MALEITSSSNNTIKHVKSLKKKKYRERYNEFIVEGLRILEHGIKNNAMFSGIFYSDEFEDNLEASKLLSYINEKDIPVYKLDRKIFKEIADTENPQGILATVIKKDYQIHNIINKDNFTIVILDRLQDPGNLGTIIRTSDAAGVDAVVITKGCVDVYNEKTVRSTMGSIFTIPILKIDDINDFIDNLIEKKINIVSTTLDSNFYHYDINYGKKNAIIIGNEGNGIDEEIIHKSNIKVKIPMMGKAESLNASVAAGIIIYETLRQKMSSENSKKKLNLT